MICNWQPTVLLNYQWKKIEAPEMVPVLRQIYEAASQSRFRTHRLVSLGNGIQSPLDAAYLQPSGAFGNVGRHCLRRRG